VIAFIIEIFFELGSYLNTNYFINCSGHTPNPSPPKRGFQL